MHAVTLEVSSREETSRRFLRAFEGIEGNLNVRPRGPTNPPSPPFEKGGKLRVPPSPPLEKGEMVRAERRT